MIPEGKTMRTVDSVGAVDSAWARLRRDANTLRRIGAMVFAYLTLGRRIRRGYHAKEAAGDIYWLDGRDT